MQRTYGDVHADLLPSAATAAGSCVLQDATADFLASDPPLEAVRAYIAKLQARRASILALRPRIPMNLVNKKYKN